jgi:hypothetical protein
MDVNKRARIFKPRVHQFMLIFTSNFLLDNTIKYMS